MSDQWVSKGCLRNPCPNLEVVLSRLAHMLALGVLCASMAPAPSPAAPPLPAQLSGQWVLDDTPDGLREKVDAAIETAVVHMPRAFRLFARPALRKHATTCDELFLDVDSQTVTRQCNDGAPLTRLLDNSEGDIVGKDGKRCDVDVTLDRFGVHLVFQNTEGGQRDHYRTEGGDTLVVTHELYAEQLPEDLVWTVRYRRAK